ncbi:Myosin-binding protein 2 [Linum grandiflorum]
MLEKKFDMGSKGFPVKKAKCSHFKHRRRRAIEDETNMPEVPPYYSFVQPNVRIPPLPPQNGSKVVNRCNEGKMLPASSSVGTLQDDAASSTDHIESSVRGDEGKQTEKDVYTSDDSKLNDEANADDERNSLRVLEQALEEERTARLALCRELEQERNAAASAADEAMAMILRLQEEKASIEMAARQYQRMIDEKSAYDHEEMSILEEMLLKREREKYFLENELEAYKMMIFGNEQLDSGVSDIETMSGNGASFSHYSSEDPSLPWLRVMEKQDGENEGIKKKEESRGFDHKEHLETASLANHIGEPTNEKNINGKIQDTTSSIRPFVHDVHIIEDKSKASNQTTEKGSEKPPFYHTFNIPKTSDNQLFSKLEAENSFGKSSYDASSGLPPIGSSKSRPQLISRRNSMSAADFERSKIDYEVGWLRERRKIVKEGREKLNIPTGIKGKEKVQLQNMEKIVGKLREIQQLSEPGNAVRRALLTPPLSGRVMSRRRRAQSVTLQTQKST